MKLDGQMYWTPVPRDNTELDYAQPWPALVQQAHHRATADATRATLGEDIVATIEWINEVDL